MLVKVPYKHIVLHVYQDINFQESETFSFPFPSPPVFIF